MEADRHAEAGQHVHHEEHDEVARPERVTVSYHEGARWMDSDEKVDGVPLPVELLPWIRGFAEQHYKPEPKKPKRYASIFVRGASRPTYRLLPRRRLKCLRFIA